MLVTLQWSKSSAVVAIRDSESSLSLGAGAHCATTCTWLINQLKTFWIRFALFTPTRSRHQIPTECRNIPNRSPCLSLSRFASTQCSHLEKGLEFLESVHWQVTLKRARSTCSTSKDSGSKMGMARKDACWILWFQSMERISQRRRDRCW